MGGALFSKPWRDLPENCKDNLTFLNSYKPQNKEVKHLRILLHGPVGSGKSSFINSVDSVFQKRVTNRVMTDAISGSSFTQKYKTFKIHKDPDNIYSFVFNDIMGFEQNANRGVPVEDVILALKGHVKENYKFVPGCQLREGDEGYTSCPTLNDRVHVLVSVVPASSVSLMSDEVVKKMRAVRLAASEIGIPQLAILTKVDEACPEVRDDVKNTYKSKHLKEQVEEFSQLLGLPVSCIFLVKNYSSEIKVNADIDALILCALRQMVSLGEDFLNDQ
ncbi:interferon-induced protein 44-like isoform X2 [Toxotes jaculatrix]|nr:interferon-induced protein 44-like isoform X2 [Toxotes jaculatrix]